MPPALLPCAALVPPWPWVEPVVLAAWVHQEAVVWGQVVLQWLWHQQLLRLPPPPRVGLQTFQVERPWAEAVDPLVTGVEERVLGVAVRAAEPAHRAVRAEGLLVLHHPGPPPLRPVVSSLPHHQFRAPARRTEAAPRSPGTRGRSLGARLPFCPSFCGLTLGILLVPAAFCCSQKVRSCVRTQAPLGLHWTGATSLL